MIGINCATRMILRLVGRSLWWSFCGPARTGPRPSARFNVYWNQTVRIFDNCSPREILRSMDPRWGLMREETMAWEASVCMLTRKAISASYDRYANGAFVPVEE